MPSKESKALHELYTSIKTRLMSNPCMSIDEQRALLECLQDPASEPTEVIYEEVQCPGTIRQAIWCKPLSASKISVILYLHGGGGFAGSPSSHRKLAGHLAKAASSQALVIDYRQAPENPFPNGLEDASTTYEWLINSQGYKPQYIGIAGDSAGGNLATALGLKLMKEGKPLPAAIAAFSPWLDMESTGESMIKNADTEALAPPGMLSVIATMYIGSASPKEPLANPLYGNFIGFPPLHISVGGHEALLNDATRLANNAKMAGVDVTLEVVPEMQHVYHFMAGRAPEATKTISEVGAWLKDKLSSRG
ncbi:hypothetical protein IQ07DRAFT_663521 [Pyrenochaeta sp. DS3sAY3a]|nr:hypothetical protein IQ07DRAFT_663521 [Pyrenochaeta sp. DS3sAY3a]